KNGNFIIMLPLSHPYTLIQIQNGDQATEIYGSPGDKLVMNVDASDFDNTLKYEGVGMKPSVANFMAKHMLKHGFVNNFHREAQQLAGKTPAEYELALDTLVDKEIDFLVDNSTGLPQSFIEFWNAYYEYSKYNNMLMYPFMHEIIKNKTYDIGDIPKENYSVAIKTPAKFNDAFLHILPYRNYVDDYYMQMQDAEAVNGKPQAESQDVRGDKMLELARKHMPAATKEYVFANYIASMVKHVPMARIEQLYNTFTSRYEKSIYSDYLKDLINKKKRLSPGAPAIDFTVADADGKKIKLSDLKGKVVYIDFWASWCGPCKAQFPHTKKIKEHFAGKDVVFVYVSIDEDEKAWAAAKEKHELTGLHTRINGWEAKLAEEYGVRGVPSYFLVDRDGNFATDDTPRPSNGEKLIEAIEALL
ncbi:MAG TPA: TlpA disulfide reductase family protein, partial [Flavipsychrobacter sp.]|nr:TlpA disulfide reductase family protein [Flavipsychrobacter sp.]